MDRQSQAQLNLPAAPFPEMCVHRIEGEEPFPDLGPHLTRLSTWLISLGTGKTGERCHREIQSMLLLQVLLVVHRSLNHKWRFS